MKLLDLKNPYLLLIIALFIAISCTTDQDVDSSTEDTLENKVGPSDFEKNSKVKPPTYSNELVVKFASHITKESEKQEIRDEFEVVSFEKCSCKDDSIELWKFEADIDILDKASSAEANEELEKSMLNYDLFNPTPIFIDNPLPNPVALQNLIRTNNSGVTIAVLDTGLDYTNSVFQKQFLYKHNDSKQCKEETLYDSWDYTNNPEADIFDENGHGTNIISTIYQTLLNSSTDFQILPIKAFDKYGETDSFKITCGLIYAKDQGADIINTSFGYYDTNIEFIQDEILSTERSVLYIAASGNDGIDIDKERRHYPSSISSDNILSVAGIDTESENLWEHSNYGSLSVDIAAQSAGINSVVGENILSGTSYAVPIVVARAAKLFNTAEGGIQGLKNSILESGTTLESLEGLIMNPVIITND